MKTGFFNNLIIMKSNIKCLLNYNKLKIMNTLTKTNYNFDNQKSKYSGNRFG